MSATPSHPDDRDPLRDVHRGDRWMVIVAHPDDEAKSPFDGRSTELRLAFLAIDHLARIAVART